MPKSTSKPERIFQFADSIKSGGKEFHLVVVYRLKSVADSYAKRMNNSRAFGFHAIVRKHRNGWGVYSR